MICIRVSICTSALKSTHCIQLLLNSPPQPIFSSLSIVLHPNCTFEQRSGKHDSLLMQWGCKAVIEGTTVALPCSSHFSTRTSLLCNTSYSSTGTHHFCETLPKAAGLLLVFRIERRRTASSTGSTLPSTWGPSWQSPPWCMSKRA